MKRAALLSLVSLASLASRMQCQAEVRLPDQAAIRAIVGEAANQSDRAMLAVAGALRSRGTLQGVYGASSPVTCHSSPDVWARAARAWAQSAQPISQAEVRLAAGCRYFGCPSDARYFLRTLHFHPVVTIGQITFYKP
jgi:hypothetical protein